MAKKEKLFRLAIELEEVIESESEIFPLFVCGQVCAGIDEIKSTLKLFNARLTEFIDNTLIPNLKK
ncbi:hypothetical protein ES702_03495 [subsurface metagenome]